MATKFEFFISTEPYDTSTLRDVEVENIYQELEELPLGKSTNYPDVKTTVL